MHIAVGGIDPLQCKRLRGRNFSGHINGIDLMKKKREMGFARLCGLKDDGRNGTGEKRSPCCSTSL